MTTFYSNGKLLITAEYVVLDGATALALPTKFGQFLHVKCTNTPQLIWESFLSDNSLWFNIVFNLNSNLIGLDSETNPISTQLLQLLQTAKQLNPTFLTDSIGYKVTTQLTFHKNWGLGSSSTLINNIANWAHVDAFQLLNKTFGGSGYDIACAQNNSAITYQLVNTKPHINPVTFNPNFKPYLYFVYLNQKQSSKEGISNYQNVKQNVLPEINTVNNITSAILKCDNFEDFKQLIVRHETEIAKITQQTPIKQRLFSDFNGEIKSLGAWGGDFILAASNANPEAYFAKKGYHTIIPYSEMIL